MRAGETPNHAVEITLKRGNEMKRRLLHPFTGKDLGDPVPAGFRVHGVAPGLARQLAQRRNRPPGHRHRRAIRDVALRRTDSDRCSRVVGVQSCPYDCPCERPKRGLQSQRQPIRSSREVLRSEGITRKIGGFREADFRFGFWAHTLSFSCGLARELRENDERRRFS